MKSFKEVLLNENKFDKYSKEAADFIEDNAEKYMDEFGTPSLDADEVNGGHAVYQKTTAGEVMGKIADYASIDDALKVIGYLLENKNKDGYRTMDIMGIALFLTKDSFDKAFPEYKK